MSRLYLLPAIFEHIAIGVGVLAIFWCSGYGYVARFVDRGRHPTPESASFAYAIGLCVGSGAAVVYLVRPLLGVVGIVVLAGGLLFAFHERRSFRYLVAPLKAACFALPFVALFATMFGLVYHEPWRGRGSSEGGDMLFYIAKTVAAHDSILPYRDLLASGQHLTLTEGSPSVLGAALWSFPGFNPFLFQAVSLPTITVLALAAGIGSVKLGDGARSVRIERWAIPVAILGACAAVYPSWIVESPPVALALPLGFALFWFARARQTVVSFVARAGIIAVALVLTKLFGLLLLVGIGLYKLLSGDVRWDDRRSRSIRTLIAVGFVLSFGVVVLVLDAKWFLPLFSPQFLPLDAIRGTETQLRVGLHLPSELLAVVGVLLALCALVRSREGPLAAGVALGIAGWWTVTRIDPSPISLGLVALMAAYLLNLAELRRQRWLLSSAAACLAASALGREYTGQYIGLVLIASLSAALIAASGHGFRFAPLTAFLEDAPLFTAFAIAVAIWLSGRHALVGLISIPAVILAWSVVRRRGGWLTRPRATAGATALILVLSLAVAAGTINVPTETDGVTWGEQRFWSEMARVVPRNGLIFTSFTGAAVTQRRGWNYFPAVGERQLYLAGWADGPLLTSRDELHRQLERNSRVLQGTLEPWQADTDTRFHSYFAAVEATRAVPHSFVLVRRIGGYALYRISTKS